MAMINLHNQLKPQGVNGNQKYPGVVVDNNDPRQLCRIRVRVTGLMDNIPDNCLPWALPEPNHCGGAYTDQWNADPYDQADLEEEDTVIERSGSYFIPTVKSKVSVRFLNGDPHFPMWSSYAIDERVALKKELTGPDNHYPHRSVLRLRDGQYIIYDGKTKELFINVAGDCHLTVLGNVTETVVGRKMTKVVSSVSGIPDYVKTAAASYLEKMKPNPNPNSPWEGTESSSAGSYHIDVEGDFTVKVGGRYSLDADTYYVPTTNKNQGIFGF